MTVDAIRLSALVDGRTFTFGEVAEEIGGEGDTLRSWFLTGGLALAPPQDVVAEKGGRSHRLHWRTVTMLLIALKLNAMGFSKKTGEAAGAAGAVFSAGLALEHLETTDSPLIAVNREADGGVRVSLIERDAAAGYVEQPLILDGWAGIGTVLIDPIGVGRIIWRMAWRQVMSEIVAMGLDSAMEWIAGKGLTFSPEEVEAGQAVMANAEFARGGVLKDVTPWPVDSPPGAEFVIPTTTAGREFIKGVVGVLDPATGVVTAEEVDVEVTHLDSPAKAADE